jgi:hypothetical protein
MMVGATIALVKAPTEELKNCRRIVREGLGMLLSSAVLE